MYTTVVVATDGSVTAERAMARAVELTRLACARLHVVTVSRGGRGPVAPGTQPTAASTCPDFQADVALESARPGSARTTSRCSSSDVLIVRTA